MNVVLAKTELIYYKLNNLAVLVTLDMSIMSLDMRSEKFFFMFVDIASFILCVQICPNIELCIKCNSATIITLQYVAGKRPA